VSWWEVNGAGCKATYPTNLTSELDPDPSRPLRPERVTGCFLDYQYIEVLHAALQCLLAVSYVRLLHWYLCRSGGTTSLAQGTQTTAGSVAVSAYCIFGKTISAELLL
jgi:hypothetical protein